MYDSYWLENNCQQLNCPKRETKAEDPSWILITSPLYHIAIKKRARVLFRSEAPL